MAGKFTVIPQETFSEMQMDAGVLLYNFDPSDPQAPDDEDIPFVISQTEITDDDFLFRPWRRRRQLPEQHEGAQAS